MGNVNRELTRFNLFYLFRVPGSVSNSVRKRHRRSWVACGLPALAHTRVLRCARRAHIRPKLASLFRIPRQARETEFDTRSHRAPLKVTPDILPNIICSQNACRPWVLIYKHLPFRKMKTFALDARLLRIPSAMFWLWPPSIRVRRGGSPVAAYALSSAGQSTR